MANEKRLTKADEVAFCAIKEFIKENGYPPTVRELCKITGKSSTASIQYRLKSLEQKGYIKTTDRGKRTIRLTCGADYVEVVHGRWLDGSAIHNGKKVYDSIDCSVCEEIFKIESHDREYWKARFKVCPFCGAVMDGDGNG